MTNIQYYQIRNIYNGNQPYTKVAAVEADSASIVSILRDADNTGQWLTSFLVDCKAQAGPDRDFSDDTLEMYTAREFLAKYDR